MDRTSEFFDTVAVLKKHAGVSPSPLALLAAASNSTPISLVSILAAPASLIARGAKRAARLADRAHRLAHVRGLFNDPGAELAELSFGLKGELRALDLALESFATGAASEKGGEPARGSSRAHWTAVAETLRERVLAATRRFQEALRARAAALTDTGARRRALAHSSWAPEPPPEDSPLFAPIPPLTQQPELADDVSSSAGGGSGGSRSGTVPIYLRRRGGVGASAGSSSTSGVMPMPHFTTGSNGGGGGGSRGGSGNGGGFGLSAQSLATMHDARARAQDAQSVEGTIVELGGMFTRMATLVAEQGDVLARIDADTEEAQIHVEAGAAELAKFYSSVKANRGLILRLFAVVAFVIVLFAVFRPPKKLII